MINKKYTETLKLIKEEILNSRYSIAKTANKEFLFLYYKVGQIISDKVALEKWGNKTIEKLSTDLQNELKGLRGFSHGNLKKMRQFYEEWCNYLTLTDSIETETQSPSEPLKKGKNQISPSATSQLEKRNSAISPSATSQLKKRNSAISPSATSQLEKRNSAISPLTTSQFKSIDSAISPLVTSQFFEMFTKLSFTAHYEIISKVKNFEERQFYILKAVQEFWSVTTLKHHLNNNLFKEQKKLPNNFKPTVPKKNIQIALNAFKDHYLLDFIALSDEEEENERVLENKIVLNIKKFLMSLGNDFAFIGNQFRVMVEDEEYFIDLLFFNRRLQALVAFELKSGKFKPEFLGKMNFYLSALDEYVKQEHENPSIGIILCKEKNNKTVEFAIRDVNKSMGVATYKTHKKLPAKYKNVLPSAETLKKLLD